MLIRTAKECSWFEGHRNQILFDVNSSVAVAMVSIAVH